MARRYIKHGRLTHRNKLQRKRNGIPEDVVLYKRTKDLDDLIPTVILKMEHQSFKSICDELGRSYGSLQQALLRRDLYISRIKYNYKNGVTNAI
jgi:hypothetical protein